MIRRFFRVVAFGCLAVSSPVSSKASDELFFDSNGVKIRYAVDGTGEPVVLVHGFSSSIEKEWRKTGVWAALAKSHQVVGLDHRGHGASEKPLDPNKYGVEMAGDVVRLMDHLKLPKAHVVGYSMGGLITEYLLVHHPDRMITATIGGLGRVQAGDARMTTMTALAGLMDNGKQLTPLIERLRPATPGAHPLDAALHIFKNNDPKALAACARSFPRLSVTDQQLEAAKLPTLAIIGDKDLLKVTVDDLKKVMPNLKVVWVEGTDHGSTLRAPKFVHEIGAFIEAHHSTSPSISAERSR